MVNEPGLSRWEQPEVQWIKGSVMAARPNRLHFPRMLPRFMSHRRTAYS